MKTGNIIISVFLLLLLVSTAGCGGSSSTADVDADDTDDGGSSKKNDYFPYYTGSIWQYTIYKDDSKVGEMQFKVTDLDESTMTATIKVSKTYNGAFPLDNILYLRKTSSGIESSTDNLKWDTVLYIDSSGTTDFNFIFWEAYAPKDLVGNLNKKTSENSITTEVGSFNVLSSVSEYDASSYDDYYYTDAASESHSAEYGFVHCSWAYSDHSMGYGYYMSDEFEIDLMGYEITMPDGTVKTGGAVESSSTAPKAPGEMTAERTATTAAIITWTDSSFNEDSFILERKSSSGSYETAATVDADTTSYTDSGLEESETYTYRLYAKNKAGNSDYTEEQRMNIFGVPRTPEHMFIEGYDDYSTIEYDATYNTIGIDFSVYEDDNIESVLVSYAFNDNELWLDTNEFSIDFDPWNSSEGIETYSINIVYDSPSYYVTKYLADYPGRDPFNTNTYHYKIKVKNSYGYSFPSEIYTVTVP